MSNATNEEPKSASTPPTTEEAQPPATSGGAAVVAMEPGRKTFAQLLATDLSFIPVLVTLLIIGVIFQVLTEGIFLQPRNLSNLAIQIVTVGTIAIAAVFILLLGEIDLSLAAVSQACGAIMAVLLVRQGWPAVLAIVVALLAGTIIGLINGFFIAVLRIPSFIVTLAGSIAYSGLLLLVLQPQTTLSIRDEGILNLTSTYYKDAIMGIGLPVVGLLIYGAALLYNRGRRQRAGLRVASVQGLAIRFVVVAVIVLGIVAGFQTYLGIPQSTTIWIGLVILFWLILTQTAYGRHIYAVGGNAEASRRAGINVVALRISIFALASTLAAVAGVLQASRGNGAASQINPTLLLNAIAAAVIGGVSLFGGRGTVWAVVLGAMIIGSLENGLDLLNQGQEIKSIVEGAVLVLAVTVDALIRRNGILTYLRNDKRPRPVSIICGVIALNLVITIIATLIAVAGNMAGVPAWFWPVILLELALVVASLVGLLQMKKWGAYAYVAYVVLALIALPVTGGLGISSLVLPVAVLVVLYQHFKEMT